MAPARRIVGLVVAIAGVLAGLFCAFIGLLGEDGLAVWAAAIQGSMLIASVGLAGFLFAKD
ncbi:MAG: hypothetical protein AABY18_08015 [Candidatus Thermoplasmatota archaeon]